MSYEIEVKAWVTDPGELQARLDAGARFLRRFEKRDLYFEGEATYGDQPVTVRIRQDGDKSVCTFKDRRTVDGVEHNREWEFSIGDPGAMETLLLRLGVPELVAKQKRGAAYEYRGLLIELSEVSGLGHFVEVEKLVDSSADEKSQGDAKQEVRETLLSFGISESAIESRPYTQMLLEQREA